MTSTENSSNDALGLHPLRFPELFDTICSFLDIKTCAKLLFLSRRTYAAVLPIVWKDVDMRDLLRLIPGANTTDISTDDSKGYETHFPATRDLTRFAIHAPFVKTLRVSDSYTVDFPYGEWPSSGPDTRTNPLLPNLQRLFIITFDTIGLGLDVKWVPRLLYPDLLGLEIFLAEPSVDENKCRSWINQDICFELVNQISRTCPRIETLRLFPEHIARSDKNNCIRIYNRIAGLHHLRSLAFSGTIVHEELLKALGRLPRLETLSLYTDYRDKWEHDESPLAVSDDSFPSLRYLYLSGLDESTMSRVCKVPPLFRHLVKTTIIFDSQNFDENMEDNERSDVAVTCLGQNSPQVEELTILPMGNNGLFFISRPTLDKFKRMPLRYLRLGHFIFDEENEEDGSDDGNVVAHDQNNRPETEWQGLLASVPLLEELHLERQPLDPRLLRLIALRLTNLRLLVFGNLNLGKVKSSDETKPTAAQPITLRGHSYFWSRGSFRRGKHDRPNEETIHNAAKYIFSIWPNVMACETQRTFGDTGYTESEPDEATAAKLYAAIQSLKAEANDGEGRQASSAD